MASNLCTSVSWPSSHSESENKLDKKQQMPKSGIYRLNLAKYLGFDVNYFICKRLCADPLLNCFHIHVNYTIMFGNIYARDR